jgi:uncharacterized membrane protein YdcZ (DUF606 family)
MEPIVITIEVGKTLVYQSVIPEYNQFVFCLAIAFIAGMFVMPILIWMHRENQKAKEKRATGALKNM